MSNQAIAKRIEQILDKEIRPRIQMDGGDISLQKFENGIAYVQLHGACIGCPISVITLKMGVETILTEHVPEVVRVEQVME